ncbi:MULTISPECIES: hypothetical protein [Microbispora]|uniref:Uncharacterized protein n=1 Tax=Microbispora siamensis TaxID=564413 RepID=A0ABQ4GHL6_9ACTN|nr:MULTISPECIES: hypothetical protein [Microbispora]GIH60911.1 hypothetical protein Msi02_17280 [Microbispora siamensis]
MKVRTVIAAIEAVGEELDEERLRGVTGGQAPEFDRSGCYADNMCKYDDISL